MNRTAGTALAVSGALTALAAVLAHRLIPSPGTGPEAWQAAAFMTGVVLFLLAFRPARKFFRHDLPVILANTVLLLLVLEAFALLALRLMAERPPAPRPGMAIPDTGSPLPFTPPPAAFHPFVGLRLEPGHRAPGVTTDGRGFRVTPGGHPSGEAMEIHMYGGSTVYGWFLPDSLTIPALLQRKLRLTLGRPVNVANRSAATRNSTQSMFEFLLALQAGDIPDAAVFYEGYNDAATAWYEGDPGSVLGNRRTMTLFTGGRREPGAAFRPSLLVLAGLLVHTEPGAPVLVQESEPLGRSADPGELASRTIAVFRSNCRQIRAMAGAFNIPVTILWQPTLTGGGRALQPDEEEFRASMDQGEVRLQELVWELARESSSDGLFTWAGDAAGDCDSSVYVDYCHMNAPGHRLVAESIAPLLVLPEPCPDEAGNGR